MSIQRPHSWTTVGLATLLSTQSTFAQAPDSASAPTRVLCAPARPLPDCRKFLLMDVAWEIPLLTSHVRPGRYGDIDDDYPMSFRWSFGMMRNTTPTRALGWSAGLSLDRGRAAYPSLEARTRFWNGKSRAFLDLTGGYTNKQLGREWNGTWRTDMIAHGFTASAAISRSDLVSAVIRGNLVFAEGRRRGSLSIGAQAGDPRAFAITLIVVAIAQSGFGLLHGGG